MKKSKHRSVHANLHRAAAMALAFTLFIGQIGFTQTAYATGSSGVQNRTEQAGDGASGRTDISGKAASPNDADGGAGNGGGSGTGDQNKEPGAGQDGKEPGTGQGDEKPETGQGDKEPGTDQDDKKPGAGQDDKEPGTDPGQNPGTGPAECTCASLCTADHADKSCPVCKDSFENCAFTEENPGRNPDPDPTECTCASLCTADHADESCPICKDSFENCAFTEETPEPGAGECTCASLCTVDRVDESCPLCRDSYKKCAFEEEKTDPEIDGLLKKVGSLAVWYDRQAEAEPESVDADGVLTDEAQRKKFMDDYDAIMAEAERLSAAYEEVDVYQILTDDADFVRMTVLYRAMLVYQPEPPELPDAKPCVCEEPCSEEKTDENCPICAEDYMHCGAGIAAVETADPVLEPMALIGDEIRSGGAISLGSGTYYVRSNVTVSGGTGQNAITVNKDARVAIAIAKDCTLRVTGGPGSGRTAGGAGICLPHGAELYLVGQGSVVATGGRGGSAAGGSAAGSATYSGSDRGDYKGITYYTGAGGSGGYGGGGPGAGIGGAGGYGGSGGSGGGSVSTSYRYSVSTPTEFNGKVGAGGYSGGDGGDMGNLYVMDSVRVTGSAGSAGSYGNGGSTGYSKGWHHSAYHTWNGYSGGGGGGGAGGGSGAVTSHFWHDGVDFYGGGGGGGGGSAGKGGGSIVKSMTKGYEGMDGTTISIGSSNDGGAWIHGNPGAVSPGMNGGAGGVGGKGNSGGKGGWQGSTGAGGRYYVASTASLSGSTNASRVYSNPPKLTVNTVGNCKVTSTTTGFNNDTGIGYIKPGNPVKLTVTVPEDHYFVGWSGARTDTNITTTFYMPSNDVTETATVAPTQEPVLYSAGYSSRDAMILETMIREYYKKLSANPYGSAYGGYYRTASVGGNWVPILLSNREQAIQWLGVNLNGTTVNNPKSGTAANRLEYGGQTYYYSTDENSVDASMAVTGPEDRAYFGVRSGPEAAARYMLKKIRQYRIHYDANGGAFTDGGSLPTGHIKLAGLPFAIPEIKNLEKDGTALSGWNTAADGSGTAFDLGGAVTADSAGAAHSRAMFTLDEDVTLYAQYDTDKIKVTFDFSGGTSGTESVLASKGRPMPELGELPVKANYTFAGYYDRSGEPYYKADGSSARSYPEEGGPTELVAEWASGRGIFAGRYSQYQVFNCRRTPAYPTASQPFRVYDFDNPYTDSGKVQKKSGQMSDATIDGKIFYFKESGNPDHPFTLWFADGLDNVDGEGALPVSKAGDIYALGKEGFLFISSQGNDYSYFISLNQAFEKGGEITYLPEKPGPIDKEDAEGMPVDPTPWTPDGSYTVTFDSNGATVAATPSRMAVRKPDRGGVALGSLPAAPTRTGYVFEGWYTAADGGTEFDGYGTPLTGNRTVYAHWSEAAATVTSIALRKDGNAWSGQTVSVRPVNAAGELSGMAVNAVWNSRNRVYATAAGAVGTVGNYAVLVGGADTGARFTHAVNTADNVDVDYFTVSYNANGGAGALPDGGIYRKGDIFPVRFAPAPAKAGCDFVGWTNRPTGLGPVKGDGYLTFNEGGAESFGVEDTTALVAVYRLPVPTEGPKEEGHEFTASQPDTLGGMGSIALNEGADPGSFEYSDDGGRTWQGWPEDGTLGELRQGTAVLIRRSDRGGDLASDTLNITIITVSPFGSLVTVEDYRGAYDGRPHGIAVNRSGDAADAAVRYYKDDTYTETLDDAPTVTKVSDSPRTVYYTVSKRGYATLKSSARIQIDPAVLTASYAGEQIRYGGTPALAVTVTGFVNGENEGTAEGYAAPEISGFTGTEVNSYELYPSGGRAANYRFEYGSGYLLIEAKYMTGGVSAESYIAPYDGQRHNISVTLSGEAEGASVRYYEDVYLQQELTGDAIGRTDVGSQSVTYRVSRQGYHDVIGSANISITQRELRMKVVATGSKVYDGLDKLSGDGVSGNVRASVELEGVLPGDTVTAVSTHYAFADANAGDHKWVNVSYAKLEGGDARNYRLASDQAGNATEAVIEPKPVTLTWSGTEKVYDGEPLRLYATVNGQAAHDFSWLTVRKIQITDAAGAVVQYATDAGTYTATATELSNSNYRLPDDSTAECRITKATLTARYERELITFGDTPRFTVTVRGFVGSDSAATAADYTAPTVTFTPTNWGDYELTPAGGAARNYDFDYVSGTLTVIAAAMTGVQEKGWSGIYDGQYHNIEVTLPAGTGDGAKITYRPRGSSDYSEANPSYTDAGSYQVYYKVSKPGYYDVTGSQSVYIEKKKVSSYNLTVADKVYDGNTDARGGITSGDIVSSDTTKVSITGTITFTDKNAGEGKAVNIGNIRLSGENAKNYTLVNTGVTGQTTAAKITPKPVTLAWGGVWRRPMTASPPRCTRR